MKIFGKLLSNRGHKKKDFLVSLTEIEVECILIAMQKLARIDKDGTVHQNSWKELRKVFMKPPLQANN